MPLPSYAPLLTGGHPNSLGRADDVVADVIANPGRMNELFACLFVEDELVRLRSSDALEKVCRTHPELLEPFRAQLFEEVPKIRQPSVQWHLAEILSQIPLDDREWNRAVRIMLTNLDEIDEWVLQNVTLGCLALFARQHAPSRRKLLAVLPRFMASSRNSVAKRARKLNDEFTACGA